jgi:glucose-1-phosphate thymidylyltransferase
VKGIVLAGGSGTRLYPATVALSKQLIPVYDKPMIYYPLSTLMLAGIRDILIISTPRDLPAFEDLFGSGAHLGLRLSYAAQAEPRGIAEALLIGAHHIGDDDVTLVLGDNIFHGYGLSEKLQEHCHEPEGCVLFGYGVRDPERYAVGEVDEQGRLVSLEEKPARPRSNRAITGLYVYDSEVVDIAGSISPSARGELEITDVNRVYLERGRASLVDLGRGTAWLDTGTHDSLLQAAQYVQSLEHRQGVRIACLEEIALRMGFIDAEQCARLGGRITGTGYGRYVQTVAEEITAGYGRIPALGATG